MSSDVERFQWWRASWHVSLVSIASCAAAACVLKAPADERPAGQAGATVGGSLGNDPGGAAGAGRGGSKGTPSRGHAGASGLETGSAGTGTGTDEGSAAGAATVPGGGGEGGEPTEAGGAGASSLGGSRGNGGGPSCTMCGGSCVNLATTKTSCGACGYACVNGRECVEGRCSPAWQPISTVGAPAPRAGHAAAFVAGKLVVSGGNLVWNEPAVASTGAYDPATDRWSAIAPLNAARSLHRAVSTGTEIYVFGGWTSAGDANSVVPSLERFVPNGGQGTWTVVSATGAPSARYNSNMVWTGSAILVYGGSGASTPTLATGGRFDPVTSKWTDASCGLAHCDRAAVGTFLDGNLVRFMGGEYVDTYPSWPGNVVRTSTGLAYDLRTNQWSLWPYPEDQREIGNGPTADDGRRVYVPGPSSMSMYDRKAGWLPVDTSPPPVGFCPSNGAFAWSGTEVIGWGANCPTDEAVGARYQPPAP